MSSKKKRSANRLPFWVALAALALMLTVTPRWVGADVNRAPSTPALYGPFEQYWKSHGGLSQFGLPLTGVFPFNEYAAQWFERAVLIYNPINFDPYKTQVQNLGWMAAASRCTEVPFQRVRSDGKGQYFATTGHNVSGKFLRYWNAKGGLAQFGYPLSEAFTERSVNGKDYLVQYFERARMELHPELAGTAYEVQLGLLGAQRLAVEGGPSAFAHLSPPAFYPKTASPVAAPKRGVYPKTGSAPDYIWVAGRVADLNGPVGQGPTFSPSVHTGPGPIYAPPPPNAMPTTYPNGVTVGRAVRGDTSPPLTSLPQAPPTASCSAMAANSFLPTGRVWEREKSKLKDGDYVVLFGHPAAPGEVDPMGDRGRPYVVDKVTINR